MAVPPLGSRTTCWSRPLVSSRRTGRSPDRPRRSGRRRRCGRTPWATPCGPCPGCVSGRRRRPGSARACGWPVCPAAGRAGVAHVGGRVGEHVGLPHRRPGCAAAPGSRARGRRRRITPPPPGTPTARRLGSLKPSSASVVTSVTGSSRTPSAASSSSGVAGSPTATSSAMPSCWSSGCRAPRSRPGGRGDALLDDVAVVAAGDPLDDLGEHPVRRGRVVLVASCPAPS